MNLYQSFQSQCFECECVCVCVCVCVFRLYVNIYHFFSIGVLFYNFIQGILCMQTFLYSGGIKFSSFLWLFLSVFCVEGLSLPLYFLLILSEDSLPSFLPGQFNAWVGTVSFTGIQPSSFIYKLSMTVFVLWWQHWQLWQRPYGLQGLLTIYWEIISMNSTG